MRRFLVIISLQAYAVLLALYQGLASVRTDEAKYLLDIPYPHPPLMRVLMHVTEQFPLQEFFWRITLATLMVQSVWIVVSLVKKWAPEKRLTLCGLWLFSSAILFQAGSIMMAPITALQGLLFVWILLRKGDQKAYQGKAGWVALLWLGSLFTAYQSVLYGPIVLAIFIRRRVHFLHTIVAIGVPIVLVAMYIAVNPLAAASLINAGGQNIHMPFLDTAQLVLGSWLWSGSVVLSLLGLVGMIRAKQWALLGSTALVFGFLFTSYRPYYAVLFLPLLVGGVLVTPSVLKRSATLLALQIVVMVWIFAHTQLSFYPSPARTVMQQLNQLPHDGVVLVSGTFGHQWQYESSSPLYRYSAVLLSKAKAVVCLDSCPGVRLYGFYPIENTATEVWVRQQ